MSACCAHKEEALIKDDANCKTNETSSCCGTATGAACCGTKACTTPCSTATGGCCDLTKMKLKLVYFIIYFNVPARAEIIRWMLAYAKAPFEDCRVKNAEWPTMKKNYPTQQLPCLEYCDPKTGKNITMTQSATIVRTVAAFTGLAGRTPKDSIVADEAFECMRDILEFFGRVRMEKDTERRTALEKTLKTELAPAMLAYLEKKVKENNGKCLSGNSWTYGDFAIAVYFDCKKMLVSAEEMTKCETEYPCLAKIWKSIVENAEVKEYLNKRPAPEKEC